MAIVPDGLVNGPEGYAAHPALHGLYPRRGRRCWVKAQAMTALEWYAWINAWTLPPAALLAVRAGQLPSHTRQCWLASPYRAELLRDSVRVKPLSGPDWDTQKAGALVKLLSPLLAQDGMQLLAVGAGLLVASERAWQADPPGLAYLVARGLPNRHPQGDDGGRLMRLHAEIEMLLAQHGGEVSGVWLWGASSWPTAARLPDIWPSVASDDVLLTSLVAKGRPRFAIHAAEQMAAGEGVAARYWLLGGDGMALLLDGGFPHLGRAAWQVRRPVALAALRRRLPLPA